jgi:L-fuculose-phosphate aldolase
MEAKTKKKKEFISHCKDIAAKQMSWGASGNFSMRFSRTKFLVTASGSHFSRMSSRSIVECSISSDKFCGRIPPSVEHVMHRAVYNQRSDVNYVVHVHPLFSVLMSSATNARIHLSIIPEAGHYLGSVATVPYIKAGTKKLAHAVESKASKADLIILKNHGIVALGKTFEEAICRTEAFEFIAQMNYYAQCAKLKLPQLK